MTTPGDGSSFSYTDDSVIAKVSVDVPDQALTNINQLTSAMAAMRAQLEDITEAQNAWLEVLRQIPDLTTATNDAIKDQIPLLERQTYLQNELGGGRGGGVFSTDSSGAPSGGAGYSTAAPAGYAPPWMQGQTPGTGINVPTPAQVEERAARLGAEDPALEANVQSARGGAANPALLTGVGAAASAIAKKFGKGKPDSGANKPQQPNDRDADAPPDPAKGGVPVESEDQNTPGDANPNDTDDSKKATLLAQIMNEFRGGKNGRAARIGGAILNAAGGVLGNRGSTSGGGGAAGSGGTPSSSGGMLGNLMGLLNKLPTSVKAAGVAGAGIAGFNAVQNIGERVTEFQQLGSVQGGDFATGMKYEAQARIMALNPFITTQQARQAMQMALKEGFRGDNYDTVQDFMIENFKELGISMGQSMEIMKSQVKGLSENESQAGIKKDLDETINTMKEMSAEGGLSLPERINQLEEMTKELTAQGFSGASINRAALATQEGLGDSLALRESAGRITSQTTGSGALMTLAAQRMGVTGILPNALPAALERAGMDPDEIRDMAASQVASYVSGYPDPLNRIAAFQMLMGQYGVELSWPEAEALYEKVSGGGELPSQVGNRKVERQGKTQTGAGQRPKKSSSPADADWNNKHREYRASDNAAGTAEDFEAAGRGSGNFAPSGRAAAPPPSSPTSPASLTSSGTVTGTVTITVDQAGRVTAPPSIQLTGSQKAALAGYGSAQLNNAPPGDPTYNHSYNTFPSGPGGGG